MDPCPFVRVLVGNLALKMPASSPSPSPRTAAASAGSGVHPTTAPCYCRIRLDKLPYQTTTAPLLPPDLDRTTAKPAALLLLGAARRRRTARLKVAVYAGRGVSCSSGGGGGGGVGSGRLIGKLVVPIEGELECSPQVLQVKGSMMQPMFTCKFSCCSHSDIRSRSV